MNRFVKYALSVILSLSLVVFSQPAAAELVGRAQVGYGTATYDILGSGKLETQDVSGRLSFYYPYEDLLFTGLFQYSRSLKDMNISRNLGQVAANYLFLEQDILRVYGGLGYQFLYNRFENANINGGKATALSGRNFVGQAVIQIDLVEGFQAAATVTGSPWINWTIHQDNTTDSNVDSGISFLYQVDLSYDLKDDLGVQLGISGTTFSVPNYKGMGTSSAGSTEVHLGVTKKF